MSTSIEIVKGDITKLKIDCIVNASNKSGLGCNIPNHCVDSAIHFAAGPLLLEECKKLGGIPTGIAKITNAYNLPCKKIIHVTGPVADEFEDHELLAQCYKNCMDVANRNKMKEIAFCCISTGLFGFSKKQSCITAHTSVINYLKNNEHNFSKVVFCTFTNEDYEIYKSYQRECLK